MSKNDKGHDLTDKLLAEMEKKIAKEYRQAAKDTQAKLNDYLRRIEVKDEKWRLMVASGEKTAAEYAEWRKGQIIIGERWKSMRDQLAADYHNANVVARSIITGHMPDAYAINFNYATYLIEKQGKINTGFTLYSRDTVERILREEPELLQPPGPQMKRTFKEWDAYRNGKGDNLTEKQKKAFNKLLAEGKDLRWQEGKIQSVALQSILQGESIPNMATRIARDMSEINHASTIRYARTAITGAENAGRVNAYKRAESMGIQMQQTWIATLDNRTRHEHRVLDGQTVDIGEPFEVDGYKIRFPGDPEAEPHLIWNCRCTTIAQIKGFERDPQDMDLRRDEKLGDMTYEKWREAKPRSQDIQHQEHVSEGQKWATIKELYRNGLPRKRQKES